MCIWAEPQPPQGLDFDNLAEQWKLPGGLAVDRDALGRDLFGIDEAPTLIVLDSSNRVQLRESRSNPVLDHVLPGLLIDLAQGVDLAASALERNAAASMHYEAELALASAVDGEARQLPEIYPATSCRVSQVGRQQHDQPIVAAMADAQEMLWCLSSSGRLQCLNSEAQVNRSLQTDWRLQPSAGTRLRLLVDSKGSNFALLDAAARQVQVFSDRGPNSINIELGANVGPIDAGWLHLQGTKQSRLAIITQGHKTILLDPTNHEQLSGDCPSAPLAVVAPAAALPSGGGFVAMQNGRIEPLQLSQESTLKTHLSSASRPQPASTAPRQVSFEPLAGPWHCWSDEKATRVMAKGWLAADEPALFLLDGDFKPMWHYRLPGPAAEAGTLITAAKDPASGQPVWAVADKSRVIHILRADGMLP